MRRKEEGPTLAFLDACETLAVDREVADAAAERIRECRAKGMTAPLPDALIAATCRLRGIALYTCNARHNEGQEVEVRIVRA